VAARAVTQARGVGRATPLLPLAKRLSRPPEFPTRLGQAPRCLSCAFQHQETKPAMCLAALESATIFPQTILQRVERFFDVAEYIVAAAGLTPTT